MHQVTLPGKWKLIICGALRDLVLFVQFKQREKQPWRSVNFSKTKPATLLKSNVISELGIPISDWGIHD